MAMFIKQATESVFHGAGGGGKDMGFDGGQVDDIGTKEFFRNMETLRIDFIKDEEVVSELADSVVDVDPFLVFIEMKITEVAGLNDIEMFVLAFAKVGVNDYGTIMTSVDEILLKTIF